MGTADRIGAHFKDQIHVFFHILTVCCPAFVLLILVLCDAAQRIRPAVQIKFAFRVNGKREESEAAFDAVCDRAVRQELASKRI